MDICIPLASASAFQAPLTNLKLSFIFQLLYFEQDTNGGYGLALQVTCIPFYDFLVTLHITSCTYSEHFYHFLSLVQNIDGS